MSPLAANRRYRDKSSLTTAKATSLTQPTKALDPTLGHLRWFVAEVRFQRFANSPARSPRSKRMERDVQRPVRRIAPPEHDVVAANLPDLGAATRGGGNGGLLNAAEHRTIGCKYYPPARRPFDECVVLHPDAPRGVGEDARVRWQELR
jgi:hypothetical protein